MDADTLGLAVQNAGYAAAGIAFLTGLFFSLNPVAAAAIPVSLAYVTKARDKRESVAFGGMFIVGLIVTHVLLGLIAGFGGIWVSKLLGRQWGVVLGPILILLGLVWAGWIRLPLPALSFRAKRVNGMWGAFAFGVPFSVAVCPICTPALVVMLGAVATVGSPLLGAVMLLAFALGRSIPIALGAWAVTWLESLKSLARYAHTFEVLGGVTMIAAGLYLLNAFFFWIPALAG
jgi:cytochrome c-type biogenesis protein